MANKWLQHVKEVKAKNPGLKFKEVLKLAAKGYKKQAGGNAPVQPEEPVPQQGGTPQSTQGQGAAQSTTQSQGSTTPAQGSTTQAGGKKSRRNRRNKNGGNKSRKNRNQRKSRRNKKGGNKSRKNRNQKKSRRNRNQRKH